MQTIFHVMRVPQYPRGPQNSPRPVSDAYLLSETKTLDEANQAVKTLTDFNTHPPGPMQASEPHHFVRMVFMNDGTIYGIATSSPGEPLYYDEPLENAA